MNVFQIVDLSRTWERLKLLNIFCDKCLVNDFRFCQSSLKQQFSITKEYVKVWYLGHPCSTLSSVLIQLDLSAVFDRSCCPLSPNIYGTALNWFDSYLTCRSFKVYKCITIDHLNVYYIIYSCYHWLFYENFLMCGFYWDSPQANKMRVQFPIMHLASASHLLVGDEPFSHSLQNLSLQFNLCKFSFIRIRWGLHVTYRVVCPIITRIGIFINNN